MQYVCRYVMTQFGVYSYLGPITYNLQHVTTHIRVKSNYGIQILKSGHGSGIVRKFFINDFLDVLKGRTGVPRVSDLSTLRKVEYFNKD